MKYNYDWHRALNEYNQVGSGDFKHWMYEALSASTEVHRLSLLFKKERLGELPKLHRQCSVSKTEEVKDNHLSCCIGTECRKCPHLLSLQKSKMSQEELDTAKAWTCVSHILHTLGSGVHLDTSEGYLLTEDDKMFWSTVYESMSNFEPAPESGKGEVE